MIASGLLALALSACGGLEETASSHGKADSVSGSEGPLAQLPDEVLQQVCTVRQGINSLDLPRDPAGSFEVVAETVFMSVDGIEDLFTHINNDVQAQWLELTNLLSEAAATTMITFLDNPGHHGLLHVTSPFDGNPSSMERIRGTHWYALLVEGRVAEKVVCHEAPTKQQYQDCAEYRDQLRGVLAAMQRNAAELQWQGLGGLTVRMFSKLFVDAVFVVGVYKVLQAFRVVGAGKFAAVAESARQRMITRYDRLGWQWTWLDLEAVGEMATDSLAKMLGLEGAVRVVLARAIYDRWLDRSLDRWLDTVDWRQPMLRTDADLQRIARLCGQTVAR